MSDFLELVVYEADDETPAWSVGTDPAHARSYLHQPDSLVESEVDLLNGKAGISLANLNIIDPQNGSTKQDRDVTALLADSEARSAVNFRRGKLWYPSSGVVVQETVITGVALSDSFAGFVLTVRDQRDRLRKIPVFTSTDTCTIFPRGVKDGYGLQANGQYLVDPTFPITGTAETSTILGTSRITLTGNVPAAFKAIDARFVVNDDQLVACTPSLLTGLTRAIHDKVVVWWRYTTGGDLAWKTLSFMSSESFPLLEVASNQLPIYGDPNGAKYNYATHINLSDRLGDTTGHDSGKPLPANGRTIQIMLQYVGPVSEKWPKHYEGTLGDFITNLVTGQESKKLDPVTLSYTAPNPRLRYNATALDALDTPVRIRATKQIEDIRNALEEALKACAGAPALDENCELAPIFYHLPAADETLLQIDETNCAAIAGWSHPTDTAVRSTSYTYKRDMFVSLKSDPLCQHSGADCISTHDVTVHNGDLEDDDGHQVDAWIFHSLGDEHGLPIKDQFIAGDVTKEIGFQMAAEISHSALDRFYYGGQSSFARIRASDFPGIKAGTWLLDARPWRPNYKTGKRGGNSLVQVASLKVLNEAWYEIRLTEAAPADDPLDAPTFDTISLTADNRLAVVVLTLPSGAEYQIQYTISDTEPSSNSGTWAFAARGDATGTFNSSPLPYGKILWGRGRSVARGVRPSAWVSLGSLTTPSTPAFTYADMIVPDDGAAEPVWVANPFCLGVRVYYGTHDPEADPPTLTDFVDVDAADGEYAFPAGSVDAGDAFSVELEPWDGWTGSAVTGTAGQRVSLTGVRNGRQFVSGVFWAAPNGDGTADLALIVHGRSDAFPVTAEFYKDSPSGSPIVTHAFSSSGEAVTSTDLAELDDVPMPSKIPPAYWAKLLDALGGSTWVPCVFAPVPGDASLEMTLKDFRITEETPTTVKYGWTRGALLDTVKVTLSAESATPTWPTTSTPPTASLAAGTDEYTITKPTTVGHAIDAIFYGVMADGTTKGPVESVVASAYSPAGVPVGDVREAPNLTTSDIFIALTDGASAGGIVYVWVLGDSPDPTGSPDGHFAISSTPATVGPTTSFSLTGGGTGTLLNDIAKPYDFQKRCFFEFVTTDGRTTGKRDFLLRTGLQILVDTFGDLKAGIVKKWSQFDPTVRAIQYLFDTNAHRTAAGLNNPATSAPWLSNDTVYVDEDASFWVWNATTHAWAAGSGTTMLSAAVLQAGSVRTVHIDSDYTDTVLLTAQDAFIDRLTVGDLTIAGHLDAADGTFVGDVSGANFTGADFTGVDFTGVSFTGVSFTGVDISGATGSFSGDVSAASFTGADFTGVSFTGVDISGATGTFSGDVSAASFTGADFTGVDFTGVDITGVTGTFSGVLSAATGSFSGDISGASGSFTGDLNFGGNGSLSYSSDTVSLSMSGASMSLGASFVDPGGLAQFGGSISAVNQVICTTVVCGFIFFNGNSLFVDGSGFVKAF